MKIKLDTTIQKAMRDVKTLANVNRANVAESLRNTGNFAKREGAKLIRNTRYSTMPGKEILSKIGVRGNKASEGLPIDKMFSEVGYFGRSVPVMYMSPRNVEVRTRLGRRWGVRVKTGLTGAFHLKREGKDWYSGRYAPFTPRSQLFQRDANGKLKPYRFQTMGEIMRNHGLIGPLQVAATQYLSRQMKRNFKRYLRQYDIGRKNTND